MSHLAFPQFLDIVKVEGNPLGCKLEVYWILRRIMYLLTPVVPVQILNLMIIEYSYTMRDIRSV